MRTVDFILNCGVVLLGITGIAALIVLVGFFWYIVFCMIRDMVNK
jgi:hypothetical protein